MRSITKYGIVLASLLVFSFRADASCTSLTTRSRLLHATGSIAQDFGIPKEGTSHSFTQGPYAKAVQQFTALHIVATCIEISTGAGTFGYGVHEDLNSFISSLYYSSFCNKAPPASLSFC
jgi:hypothetical protein